MLCFRQQPEVRGLLLSLLLVCFGLLNYIDQVLLRRPRNDEHSEKQEIFQNPGEFVIARLAMGNASEIILLMQAEANLKNK